MDQNPAQTPTPLSPSGQKTLADTLLELGFIDAQKANDIKVSAITQNTSQEQTILTGSFATREQLIQAKSALLNVPAINLSQVGATPEALSMLHESVAKRYKIFPFAIDKPNNKLSIAMVNPMDLTAIEFIERKSGMHVVPHLADENDLLQAIKDRYSQNLSSEVVEALADVSEPQKRVVDVSQLGQVIHEAPVAKIVQTILEFAVKSRASDVHIEPGETRVRIRYRIDGILSEKLVLPKEVNESVVSRIKILAHLKIDERRLPQDGRFAFSMSKQEIDLRISTLPTVHGEKVVMRLLKKTNRAPSLVEIGLRALALKQVEHAIQKPNGIILVTGPTGSGKTTTLFSILSRISTPKINVMTLEDPVEYEIPGVNQVQINPQAGLTFASGLRSFLRQDPDVIMVGEIRDSETAELAIQASLTGHLVFSTLHTNSASGAIPRLVDMDTEPFLIASSLVLVIGQRVIRVLCDECKKPYQPAQEIVADLKSILGLMFDSWIKTKNIDPSKIELYKPVGCAACGDTGYKGRDGIYEILNVSEKISKLIVEQAPDTEIQKQAISEGMVLMKQDGYLRALQGITTIEEVLRVAET